MKPGSERPIGIWIPMDPSLESVLGRLEALSLEPAFAMQRQLALAMALRPYAEYARAIPLEPLPEEIALAKLYAYADFFPQDGQLSLIEQLRDTITIHIPEEEREWLDPLRHSYMDLVEVTALDVPQAGGRVEFRSLGDGRSDQVAGGEWTREMRVGQIVLTRLVHRGDHACLPGTALVLSPDIGRLVFQQADQWRRDMEVSAGVFGLGEWTEFAKRYGYVLLWNFAQVGLEALVRADQNLRYVTAQGQPFLYAVALYDHHEYRMLAERLAELDGLQTVAGEAGDGRERVWEVVERPDAAGVPLVVARLTLSRSLLSVECDTPTRLNELKHLLASTFGFSLRFRGDTVTAPPHAVPEVNLSDAGANRPGTVVVGQDREHRLLSAFLESIYLDWADRSTPALNGETPRHRSATEEGRRSVAALIEELESMDLARRRTGRSGFDYRRLRDQVGL